MYVISLCLSHSQHILFCKQSFKLSLVFLFRVLVIHHDPPRGVRQVLGYNLHIIAADRSKCQM